MYQFLLWFIVKFCLLLKNTKTGTFYEHYVKSCGRGWKNKEINLDHVKEKDNMCNSCLDVLFPLKFGKFYDRSFQLTNENHFNLNNDSWHILRVEDHRDLILMGETYAYYHVIKFKEKQISQN